jgi:hypothetical protein
MDYIFHFLKSLICDIYHMLHCHRNYRCLFFAEVHMSLQDQVNVKQSGYSNTCCVAYLCDEAAGHQKSGILLLALVHGR